MNLPPLFRHRHVPRAAMIAMLALLIGYGAASAWRSLRNDRGCRANLDVIYQALLQYERQYGSLPELAFYPENVDLDADSLYPALAPFGVQARHCLCPASPPVVRETGISYIWNVQVNGSRLRDRAEPVWLLMDLNAISSAVPTPHRGTYHVLFSDGSVRKMATPPRIP